MAGASGTTPAGTTWRQAVPVSRRGDSLRLRFTNTTAHTLVFGAMTVAVEGEEFAFRTPARRVTAQGSFEFAVPAGESVRSDPVAMRVAPGERILVSTWSSRPLPIVRHPDLRRFARFTAPAGEDLTAEPSPEPFTEWASLAAWIDLVELETSAGEGCAVAVGDSITDGSHVPFGSSARWTDVLTDSLLSDDRHVRRRWPVLNAGLDGGTLCGVENETIGPAVLSREARDIADVAGVRAVILLTGTNDISTGRPVDACIAALAGLADRAHRRGAVVLGCTLLPRAGGTGWDSRKERDRLALNAWLRDSASFDAVADLAAELRDNGRSSGPDLLRPELDADGTHPNRAGHAVIAQTVSRAMATLP